MKAEAPGKLILSGEHSVVYGAPALAIAVSHKVRASFQANQSNKVSLCSGALSRSVSLDQLPVIHAQLNQRYDDFLHQRCLVSDILTSPAELLFYTLAHAGLETGGEIGITSDLPTGAGMGSSAAVIGALVCLSGQVQKHSLTSEDRFNSIRFCERLQHGRGSAIDAAAVTYGGCVRVQEEVVTPLSLQMDQHWYVWNSGQPRTSTGETVSAVRQQFQDSKIWQQFSSVTQAFERALANNDPSEIIVLIRQNHALLEQIEVVPAQVSQMIRKVEQLGGAAKVCGAGAHSGHQGGMVLIYHPVASQEQLQHALDLSLEPLTQAEEGAHIATT